MPPSTAGRVRLVDAAEQTGRTTATLLASLTARLGSLFLVSGADGIGSIAAGLAALGRQVAGTVEGARLGKAIEAGRAGANGDLLWSELRIEEWLSTLPPSPVLDQLRNDFALLLATDVEQTLELLPIPSEVAGIGADQAEQVRFVDYLVGLWAFSAEVVRAVELLAGPTLAPPGSVYTDRAPDEGPEGSLLR
ncbi:MAG: hypothetical protein JF888_09440 [Candidatus Dormibacteraeota bacterium]|uniref:Uncharacterized protein n=1 Tax=Candidatus Dormiibacter inghamiae TaxID=3127013 RepID=A0A934NDY8_9BACT|nr:hypothetical protein [Candidatus Dormibacteraeota bacterium]MBJ7606787.1 hypothetical protein [Candidatus Dormibacteraeota bacterium]